MEYKNIIFDFDGTLADTAAAIVETMHCTIRKLGLPNKTGQECRDTIGYRLEDIPSILWPEIPDLSQRYVTTYREIFNSVKDSINVRLYPNVRETIVALYEMGVNMAIASSRSRISLQEYTDKLGISSYFQCLIGGGDVTEGKPSPEPVNRILSLEGWSSADTLVVGDMNVDILMGDRAGAATCGVTYGNGSKDELRSAGATHIIDDFARLLSLEQV